MKLKGGSNSWDLKRRRLLLRHRIHCQFHAAQKISCDSISPVSFPNWFWEENLSDFEESSDVADEDKYRQEF